MCIRDSLFENLEAVGPNLAAIDTLGAEHFGMEKSIAANPVLNGLNYMGTVIIWFITFITMMAVQSEHKKEVKLGAVAGCIAFMLSLLLVALAMIAVIAQVGPTDAPSIVMAGNVWPPLAAVFALSLIHI